LPRFAGSLTSFWQLDNEELVDQKGAVGTTL
jgi:hypothetical protein